MTPLHTDPRFAELRRARLAVNSWMTEGEA